MPYSDSEPSVVELDLRGIWIHDPDDPEGTIKHFPYGNQAGKLDVELEQSATHVAGRQFPITDFGDFLDIVMGVSVQVIYADPYYPMSGTLYDLMTARLSKRAFTVRDGGGRMVTGIIEGWSEGQAGRDTHSVSFNVRQDDRPETLVEV
jgi:hypothetical protein